MSTTIDFAAAKAGADLPGMLAAEGIAIRSGMAFCPFHENSSTPALSVYRRDGIWKFKCHACGAAGDPIDWLRLRDSSLSVIEATRRLDPLAVADPQRPRSAPVASRLANAVVPPRPALQVIKAPEAWEDEAWQAAADALIRRAESDLWAAIGREARGWLHRRGLEDATIRRFRLGFVPDFAASVPLEFLAAGAGPKPIVAPRGVVLPWLRPGSWHAPTPDPGGEGPGPRWVGANVRRLAADVDEPMPRNRKCMAFTKSVRGHAYPEGDVLPSQAARPALIVEGEWDALLAWQEAGDLVNVVTVGGSEQAPQPEALASLDRCPYWLCATDHDAAGDRAAARFAALSPMKARRLYLPRGKDLGEYHACGGDVRSWVRSEIDRLGLRR